MKESTPTTNITEYFHKLTKELKIPLESATRGKSLAAQVSQKMQQKILMSEILLPELIGTQNLNITKTNPQPTRPRQQDLLRKVESQKITLLQKMKDLAYQEDDLKTKIKRNFMKQKNIFKSNMTQQDKNKLKQLVRENRLFQRSLEKKNQQLVELYRQKSLDEIKEQEQLNQSKKRKKRIEILQTLKTMQLKSAQRKQAHENFKKQLKELKQKKYLYAKNLQKDEEMRVQSEQQLNRKLIEIRNSLKLDIEEIREHQRKYQQHLSQAHERLQQKSLELSKNRRSNSFGQNYFSAMMKARIQQQKASQYERMNHGYEVQERMNKFKQKIKKQFKPKISNGSKFIPSKHIQSAKSLSNVEQRQKGIEYLELSKKLKDLEKEKKRRMTLASPKIKNQYKDYTKQLKYKGYDTAEAKFNTLVKYKSSLNSYESASQALELANQIQAKSKLLTDKKLLISVKNKIQLLSALE